MLASVGDHVIMCSCVHISLPLSLCLFFCLYVQPLCFCLMPESEITLEFKIPLLHMYGFMSKYLSPQSMIKNKLFLFV